MTIHDDTALRAPEAAEREVVPDSRATERPAVDRLAPGDKLVIGLLLVAGFVVILNETAMGVALPVLMSELDVSAATGQWLTTGFMLTMAVVIPATGFLIDRFRTRQIFIAAMTLFVAGTTIAALAPGFGVLLAGRVVQASGTAVMIPLLMTTVLTLVPPAIRGRTMGTISIVISVAPAIGPTLSGLVLSQLSWRWIFLLMLPIALVALALGVWKIRDVTTPRDAHLDLPSLGMSAVGFGALIYGLSSIGESASGHTPVAPWVPITVGVLALAVFIRRQLRLVRTRGALMDLRVFADRSFTVSTTVLVISFMAMFGALIVLPIFLQEVLEKGTLQTGLLLLPGGVAMGAMSPVVGRLFDRIGPRPLVTPGAVAMSAALWLMSTFDAATTAPTVVAVHTLLSIGLAFMITPLFTSALGSLRPELYGHGSAIINTVQQLAGAAGTALFITVLATATAAGLAEGADVLTATADGVQGAFLWGGIVSLVAVGASLLVRRPAPVPGEPVGAH